MHVRVRLAGQQDAVIVVDSKLTLIDKLRTLIELKFNITPECQRLFYGGKQLENGYSFHDYNIRINDIIQLIAKETIEQPRKQQNKKKYLETDSKLYTVGDLVDVRNETGAWFECKITQIVYIPHHIDDYDKENNDILQKTKTDSAPTSGTKAIKDYFKYHKNIEQKNEDKYLPEEKILYKVCAEEGVKDIESEFYCKSSNIRPRARHIISCDELKTGMTVMLNYNKDDINEIGHWFDCTITTIKKTSQLYELKGTVYLGEESIAQDDTLIKVHDNIFSIEHVIPLLDRSEQYQKLMFTPTEIRSSPLNCLKCRDNENITKCVKCGCSVCFSKDDPEKTLLCDECGHPFHMYCLNPPLKQIPEDDWYCPECKNSNIVVAPGAAKQSKKNRPSTSKDWGRGMACVGKTKSCAMPSNHFGPIPGTEVGMIWKFRIQLSEIGIHRPPVSGIHGRDNEGAYSLVLSGGYADDYDNGDEFIYSGSGGRDLKTGNKRTAEQSSDQKLTRENRALARNCFAGPINDKGGDAGDNWREGKPVRVVRSSKLIKHGSKYAPGEGFRYDGIYKVVKYYPADGVSGFKVWKYILRRDDSTPSPWSSKAKKFEIQYPDGYLEAEAQKKAVAGQKRAIKSKLQDDSDDTNITPRKKAKISKENKKSSKDVSSTGNIHLSNAELDIIKADILNKKYWDECLEICTKYGKQQFVERVTETFKCIICQEVAVNPTNTKCLHIFCIDCINLSFKATKSFNCPCCRLDLEDDKVDQNSNLKLALQTVLPGYDAHSKKSK